MKFVLGQQVQIEVSGEQGRVIARVEYEDAQHAYAVRYKSADGRAVAAWWNESALISA